MGPLADTATITTVMSTNRVDSGRLSSRCWVFRRTHTSSDLIRLLCIRLALPLTLALTIRAQRKTHGCWRFTSLCDCRFDERGGGVTRQPVGPLADTATITTAMSTNRADTGSFSSRCGAFQRRHKSADPIRLLCTRLALPLTVSLPSRFTPSARLMFDVSPRALWLADKFSCHCMFWGERRRGLTGQPIGPLVNTATLTTAIGANRVDSGSCNSRCCTFRRTHTSADRIRLLYYPTTFTLYSLLTVDVPPRTLRLAGIFMRKKERCAGVVGTRTD